MPNLALKSDGAQARRRLTQRYAHRDPSRAGSHNLRRSRVDEREELGLVEPTMEPVTCRRSVEEVP